MLVRIYKETYKVMGMRALKRPISVFYIVNILSLFFVVFASNLEKYYVDNVLDGYNYKKLMVVVLLFSISALGAYIINCQLAVYRTDIRIKMVETLKSHLIRNVFHRPICFAKEADTDDLKMRIDTDTNTLTQFYESIYATLIPSAVSFLVFSILMLQISIWLSIALIFLAAVSNIAELRIGKALDKYNLVVRERTNRINNLMYSELSNYVPFKVRNMQEINYVAFTNSQASLKDAYYIWMFSHIKLIVMQIIKTDFLQKAIIYLASAYGVLSGRFSIGSTILMLNYFLSLSGYLSSIINELTGYRSSANSYNRCIEFLKSSVDHEAYRQITVFEELNVHNLCFAYKNQQKVLTGADLLVGACDKLAIIGGSGQGKTTLIKCIAQLEKPVGGTISVNSVEVGDVVNYYKTINITMQDASLFDLTVWENLTLGNESIDKEVVCKICERVGILEDIVKLKDGFDTKIGTNGAKLSGGQRQKIIIARALLGGAQMLILDEANSALDEESEEIINNFLLEYKDKTIVVVSHRKKTIDAFPKKYILKEGKIVEYEAKSCG